MCSKQFNLFDGRFLNACFFHINGKNKFFYCKLAILRTGQIALLDIANILDTSYNLVTLAV